MTERIFNFSAGPAVLPVPVLERAREEMLSLRGLLGIPDGYRVLFLQGGASLQFSMVPMNFLPEGGSADYVLTGSWGKKALKEAKKVGGTSVAADMADSGYNRIPAQDELKLDPGAAYLHF